MWRMEKVMEKTLSKVDLIEIYQQLDYLYHVELHSNRIITSEEKKIVGFSSRCRIKDKIGFSYANTAHEAVSEALKSAEKPSPSVDWTLPRGPFEYPHVGGLASSSLTSLTFDDFIHYIGEANLTSHVGTLDLLRRKTRIINNLGVKAQKLETLMEVYLNCEDGSQVEHTMSRDCISIDTLEQMNKRISGAKRKRKAHLAEFKGSLLVPGRLSHHLCRNYLRTAFQIPAILDKYVLIQDISLVDDGTLPGGIFSSPFDGEGTPCKKRELIIEGKATHIMLDSSQAARQHTEATGNVTRVSWQSSPTLIPNNLIFYGKECNREELRNINEGVIATRLKAFLPILFNRNLGEVFLIIDGFFVKDGHIKYFVDNVKAKFNFFTSLRKMSELYQEYQQPYLQDFLFENVEFL